MGKHKKRKPVHWFRILLALSLLSFCLWFIWSNSMLSAEDSERRSRIVTEYLARFLRLFFSENNTISRYLIQNVRKVAHAVEFFTLGSVSVIILWLLNLVNAHMTLHAVLLLLAVAVTDETLQLFFHRGSQVSDIILDFAGGMSGLCVTLFLTGIGMAAFSRKGR